MVKNFIDLKFVGSTLTSTAEELLQYMVYGFTDDFEYYEGLSQKYANAYRDKMIQELKQGEIPSDLRIKLTIWKMGIRRWWI